MTTAIVFDIETGGLPDESLRQVYREKTAEEFAAECDKRWKPETVAQKYEEYTATAWQDFKDHAALSAITGQVVAIGLQSAKGVKILAGDEADVIKAFWALVTKAMAGKRRMIGHNIHCFDLPFMVRRSWMLGIDTPENLRNSGRYWCDTFVDTMQVWGFGNNQERISLDKLSRALGGQGKPEGENACTGATFAKLWLSGDPELKKKAEAYLTNDLTMTWAVAGRMNLL